MRQIYPDDGLTEQLLRIANDSLVYRLYTNNISPDTSTSIATLTEAAWTGYAPVTLDDTDFTTVGVTGHVGFILGAPISFVNLSGSAVDAYGYYVTDVGNTKLLAAARFDGAPVTKNFSEVFIVVPTWADFSQFQTV